ncbi:T9SS type A sorting domain-containing protein [Pedobacter xixiisoli]|uniref:Por secretion system C-terminal sorting domain-containing protein n=1 Tax=Pedobacter xixiisoli TaxID=1476464 RepID=A0A286A921_9SPHI|nr:T9SS type A sorting domain-containing protein [Pedobacter xixiisoli]SOD18406.1 Por secretion system C-terminal sorting domain-containing protein [Pedobacter xixiisoli]
MRKLYFLILIALSSHSLFAQTTRYVTPTGSGTGTGGWANASSNLQGMIDASASGDEIRVAAGTYYPSSFIASSADNRDKAFILRTGVKVLGGYSTIDGSRDFVNNVTVLSGDLGTLGDKSDNAYHVVTARVDDVGPQKAILDGFSVTAGNANGTGSLTAGSALNRNQGGAINLRGLGSSKRIEFRNLIISNNASANFGGAVYAHISINAGDTESILFDNVSFQDNTAGADGGAIYILRGTSTPRAIISNSSFIRNKATGNEGGAIFSNSASTTLTISGSTFNANEATSGGAINAAGVTNITTSTFKENKSTGSGSAIYLLHAALTSSITNTSFQDNVASGNYGAIYFSSGTTTYTGKLEVLNSIFKGNIATVGSGGALYAATGELNVVNSAFAQNQSGGSGGGAIYAGSINTSTILKLMSNTFYGNLANAGGVGGAVAYYNSGSFVTLEFYNNIFNSNSAEGNGDDTRSPLLAAGTYKNNLFQLTRTNNGTNLIGNISNASPTELFASTTSTDPNFLQLIEGAATQKGDNALIPSGITTDLAGNARITHGTVDLGAYEFQGTLPVTLKSYDVVKKGPTSVLKWTTESEQNNQKFVVERASSAKDFTFFKEVVGAGDSSSPLTYSVTDYTPLAGVNYYRLTQFDKDGTSKILGVDAVSFDLNVEKTAVYPNPARSYVKVKSNSQESIVSLNLISLTGKNILTNNYAQSAAYEGVKLELADIPTGTYILWINKGKPNAEKQTLLVVK